MTNDNSNSWQWNKERLARDPMAPRVQDLPIALVSFAVCSLSRLLATPLFAALGRRVLSKERYGRQHECRVQRFAGQCWKLLFHGTATVVPLVLLRGQRWWPAGFAADPAATFEHYPDVPRVPHLREFYMFELGYYLHAFVATLKQQHRPNYVEMTVHHVITIDLVVYSYFVNNVLRYGTLVFWVHDVCDVPVCLTRLLLDFNCIVPTALAYFALMSLWVFYRLYVYTFVLVPQIIVRGPQLGWFRIDNFPGWAPISVLLCGLVVMHLIWFKELLGMAGTYFQTGCCKDSTDENKEDMAKLQKRSVKAKASPAKTD